jgi:hypothetical protein
VPVGSVTRRSPSHSASSPVRVQPQVDGALLVHLAGDQVRAGRVPFPATAEYRYAMRSGVCELGPWPIASDITSEGTGGLPKRSRYQSSPVG